MMYYYMPLVDEYYIILQQPLRLRGLLMNMLLMRHLFRALINFATCFYQRFNISKDEQLTRPFQDIMI